MKGEVCTPFFPGMTHFHVFKSVEPSGKSMGCALLLEEIVKKARKTQQDGLSSTVFALP